MDHQVKIILTALNGNVTPTERTITLHPKCSDIRVGRASKSPTKGLLGKVDNAWFDSPVMSRDHAKISFDTTEKTVTIEDIGSMHGTYLNNVQLPANTSQQINDNDELKFGAEVRRGPEIYPACRFRIQYEVLPYKPTNTFEFPEYSDAEDSDDEDCQYSDDDPRQQTSSEDGISIESPASKASKDVDAIDLTTDESPIPSPVIDLTEETPPERPIMSLMVGCPANIDDNADHASTGVYAGNPMTVIDVSEEDTHFSSDSEDHHEDDNCIDSESSEEEIYSVDELDEIEILDSDEEEYNMEEGYPEDDVQEAMMDTPDAIDRIARFAIATHENASIRLSKPQASMDVAEPMVDEDGSDSDSDSDFGLSEAGAEGMRVMYRDGLLQKHSESVPSLIPQIIKIDNSANFDLVEKSAESVPVFQSTTELSPSVVPVQQHLIEKPLGLPSLSFRQPSPSDAAMVKTRVATADTRVYGNPTIQSLGEKSGKSSYFAAREVNKLKFSLGEPKNTVSNSKAHEAHNMLSGGANDTKSNFVVGGPFAEPRTVFSPEFGQSSLDILPQSGKSYKSTSISLVDSTLYLKRTQDHPKFDSAMPTRDKCSFLDKPDTRPLPLRAPSPLPDMTSAMNYTASKDSMTAAAKAASNTPRTALKIKEMCDSTSSTPTLKRKVEYISSSTDEELKSWGNDTSNSTQCSSNVVISTSEPKPEQVAIASSIEGPRPSKKFKKFMEKVGYAAIGGVAVGASLFTALVATAPNFS